MSHVYRLIYNTYAAIGSGKGGAMRLQPYLILRVLHGILVFSIEIFSFSRIASPDLVNFLGHCPHMVYAYIYAKQKQPGAVKKGAAKQSRIKSIVWHLNWFCKNKG